MCHLVSILSINHLHTFSENFCSTSSASCWLEKKILVSRVYSIHRTSRLHCKNKLESVQLNVVSFGEFETVDLA